MFLTIALAGALAVAPSDTIPVLTPLSGAVEQPVGIGAPVRTTPSIPALADDTVPSRRRKAVEVSDAYAIRLKIHYLASYATLPIFAAQAVVGEQLYNDMQNGTPISKSMRDTHDGIAVALGALFVTNTVTGAWNWWETRHNEKGRTWRTVHAALMLVADAGFAYTATLGPQVTHGTATRDTHRNWAEGSAGVALASYIMMWKPFRRD
jgi:hypothetical protein